MNQPPTAPARQPAAGANGVESSLAALLLLQGQTNAKRVALLGVLVAMNAIVRFAEVAVPGPGGFSPVFFLVILGGYVFGRRFGFMLGVMTILVSSLITGAVGPWMPHQMLATGWVGLLVPSQQLLSRLTGRRGSMTVLILAIYAGIWGMAYGAIMNLWFWPYASGPVSQTWEAGLNLGGYLTRYGAFYLATSAWWDLLRALGNVTMILALGKPTMTILERFQRRFAFSYQPAAVHERPLGAGDDAF